MNDRKSMVNTKINSLAQTDFITSENICYDFKTDQPCIIDNGVLQIGDGGEVITPEVLQKYDIYYFHEQEVKQ